MAQIFLGSHGPVGDTQQSVVPRSSLYQIGPNQRRFSKCSELKLFCTLGEKKDLALNSYPTSMNGCMNGISTNLIQFTLSTNLTQLGSCFFYFHTERRVQTETGMMTDRTHCSRTHVVQKSTNPFLHCIIVLPNFNLGPSCCTYANLF